MSALTEEQRERQSSQMRTAIAALAIAATLVFGGGAWVIAAHGSGLFSQMGDYSTIRLVPGSYSSTIECPGTVEPIRVTNVLMPQGISIERVLVKDGDYVKQGAALFETRDADGKSQVVAASATGTIAHVTIADGMDASLLPSDGVAMQIIDMNMLVGIVEVPGYVSTLVDAGQYVSMSSQATPGIRYSGMVTGFSKGQSSELAGDGQALYDATVMFDDSGELKLGDSIEARLYIEDYGQVYYVPAAAVAEEDGRAFVDIVRSSRTIERHQVELLGTSGAGEKIIRGDSLTSETIIRADLEE